MWDNVIVLKTRVRDTSPTFMCYVKIKYQWHRSLNIRQVGDNLDVSTSLTPTVSHLLSLYLVCCVKQGIPDNTTTVFSFPHHSKKEITRSYKGSFGDIDSRVWTDDHNTPPCSVGLPVVDPCARVCLHLKGDVEMIKQSRRVVCEEFFRHRVCPPL